MELVSDIPIPAALTPAIKPKGMTPVVNGEAV
jgi:hypothetical protein